jgi:hypothetical protein
MRQALELAFEALEGCYVTFYEDEDIAEAITALRQAIEQAQKQEPLCTAAMFDDAFLAKSGLSPDTKLYTSPPQRQPLTPESVFQIADQHPVEGFDPDIMAFARAIEAAHGIKE